MPLHIYRCGYLSTERERDQMGNLLLYLERDFEQRREECTFIIEPSIPCSFNGNSVTRKPDALLIKDGIFVLIDLKAFEGEFEADCSPDGQWTRSNGELLLSPGRERPLNQAKNARLALIRHLVQNYVKSENAPGWAKRNDDGIFQWVERSIRSWVVTWEGSIPKVTGKDSHGKPVDDRNYPYFRVLSTDRLTAGLSFLRGEPPLLGTEDLARLIGDLGAEPTNRIEWMRGALVLGRSPPIGMIPRIADWMDSGDGSLMSKALDRVRELDLKSHLAHVVRCWEGKRMGSLRQVALVILIEWQYERLGDVLSASLVDDDQRIAAFTLQFLTQNSYPETVPALIEKLTQSQASDRPTILKALAFSGSSLAGPAVLSFVEKEFASRPFKEFQHFADKAHEFYSRDHGSRDAGMDAFARQDQARIALIQTYKALADALGDLDFKPAVTWLLGIVEHPTSVGFESDEFKKLELRDSDYYSVFGSVCKALGTVGRGNPAVRDALLARLSNSPDDYRDLIMRALGDLGDQAAVPRLIRFVGGEDKYLTNVAVDALSKLRPPDSFEPVARLYFGNPHAESAHWTAEALVNIDPRRFEVVLLKWIRDPSVSDEDREIYLHELWPVATPTSADTLFALLPNPRFADTVPWILARSCQDDQVFTRTMELTMSKNPIEAGGAIEALTDYFVTHLTELDRYLTPDSSVEVRRAVTDVYYVAKSKANLMKFARDPDEHIRDTVFLAFKGVYHENQCRVTGFSGVVQSCEIGLDKDGQYLAIRLANEVHVLPVNTISLSFRSTQGKSQGLYLKYRTADGTSGDLLISIQCESLTEARLHLVNLLPTIKLNDGVEQETLAPGDQRRVQELWEMS